MFDDDMETRGIPLKFHITIQDFLIGCGLKWRRGRVKSISFPRSYLEHILDSTEDDEVTLNVNVGAGLFVDIDDHKPLGLIGENEDEIRKSQEEFLEAKKSGKVN